ncbi:hypothetical protein KI387_015041, partial [Taxus chinensis]
NLHYMNLVPMEESDEAFAVACGEEKEHHRSLVQIPEIDKPYIVEGGKEKEREDSCHACGGTGSLICCDECNSAYHLKCLKPTLRVVPQGNWSCPEC